MAGHDPSTLSFWVRALLSLGLDFVRHPIQTWRNAEAVAEFDDALNAEFQGFCQARGLSPEAEGSWEAWWDAVDAMIAAFAVARGLEPDGDGTLDAFEAASAEFATWCEHQAVEPFALGQFERWLQEAR